MQVAPDEIKALREGHGLTRDDLGGLIDRTAETIKSFELGRRGCNGPVAYLVRLAARVPGVVGRLRKIDKGGGAKGGPLDLLIRVSDVRGVAVALRQMEAEARDGAE